MDSVEFILRNKGRQVHTISATATVLEATREMNRHRIGALVVIDGDQVAGIFTERDVLCRVVGEDVPPSSVRVAQVMTRDVLCCAPEMDIEDASLIMRDKRIRHLPVCDCVGRLLGIISIGDLNAYYASSQDAQIENLHQYVFGRA